MCTLPSLLASLIYLSTKIEKSRRSLKVITVCLFRTNAIDKSQTLRQVSVLLFRNVVMVLPTSVSYMKCRAYSGLLTHILIRYIDLEKSYILIFFKNLTPNSRFFFLNFTKFFPKHIFCFILTYIFSNEIFFKENNSMSKITSVPLFFVGYVHLFDS